MQESTTLSNESFQEQLGNTLGRYYDSFVDILPRVGLGLLIIILGILLAGVLSRFITKRLKARTHDPLMSRFLGRTVKTVLVLVVIVIGLQVAGFGNISAGLFATAGAGAVIFGFAFKDIGQNFIAGVILSFNRPFNVDDTVEIGPNFGRVKALEFRYTKLKTFDGKDVYIPNSDVITQPVTNYTEDGYFRWQFMVGIDYEDDVITAKETIMKTLLADPKVISTEAHRSYVTEDELATSTVNLKVMFWIDTKDYAKVATETRGRVIGDVKKALMAEGFYLPADIQEIKLYGRETDIPLSMNDLRKIKND